MTGPPAPDPGDERDGHVIAQSLEHPELFARLYDRYAPDIHRYAARRLGDHAADDVTADTFLTAFRVPRSAASRCFCSTPTWRRTLPANATSPTGSTV
ncbi:sigma factor, partial [Streptomyces sp. NPDC002922]|uniref:RNA polymerase sigma factor n=1 Tax=Streptomyces sp. NPDC002922 TaxID=3154439 RepID=UPI0033A8CE9D